MNESDSQEFFILNKKHNTWIHGDEEGLIWILGVGTQTPTWMDMDMGQDHEGCLQG